MTAVSVLIPACRAEATIARALRSLQAQRFADWEAVIASDDERDYISLLATQGVMDRRLRCVMTGGTATGAANARNAALAVASGRFIAPLDADDAFLPDHLETLLPLAKRHGAAISQVEFTDHATDKKLPNRTRPSGEGLLALEDLLLACLHSYVPSVFDRERVTHAWHPRIPLLEDAVFVAGIYNTLPGVWYRPQPSYRYYRREDSMCNAPESAQRFLAAGRIIIALLDGGGIAATPYVDKALRAYIARNDGLEHAFEQAAAQGLAKDYQDFLGQNLAMLHQPLL